MIQNNEQLINSQERLDELRSWKEEAVNDFNVHPRLKKSQLAGIRGMIDQIEKEIRAYHLTRFRESLKDLQIRSQKSPPEKLPELFTQMLGAMEELTAAMQPTS